MEVGTKVYGFSRGEITKGTQTGEEIIGEVMMVKAGLVFIKSIIDDREYALPILEVFEVGTGPGVSNTEIVYEDYYV